MSTRRRINDDILLHIFSYLHGGDALRVALCSKHFYQLALPRIPAIAKCQVRDDLQAICKYMLSGTPLRARRLEELMISIFAFAYPGEGVGEDDDEYSDFGDWTQARFVADLLLAAPRLRVLCLERLHMCLETEPRIARAIGAMERLVDLEFSTLGDGSLARLGRLPVSLRTLRLTYFWSEDDDLEEMGETKTLGALLGVVVPLRNLHTLDLWRFEPEPSREAAWAQPRFPNIRDVRLMEASPSALELVELCPGVESVLFDLETDHGLPTHLLRDGPRWAPLRQLIIAGPFHACYLLHRVGRAENVVAIDAFSVDHEGVESVLKLISLTQPLRLSLSVCLSPESVPTLGFWRRVAGLAPQLRILEVRVTPALQQIGFNNWLDDFANDLRPLTQLAHVSIVVPTLDRRRAPKIPPQGMSEDGLLWVRRYYANAREAELHRANALGMLHVKLAEALPSLRFLSVAAGEVNMDNFHGRLKEEGAAIDMMKAPLSLDDDVLLSIFSYIYGEDALNAALACKRFCLLALPRVATRAYCWNLAMLRRLCTYMLSDLDTSHGPQARARQLRVLFCSRNTSAAIDNDDIQEPPPIGCLLAKAHNLRILRWYLNDFHNFFTLDPRIGPAVKSLRCLSVLELCGVDNETIDLLQHVVTLEVLTLDTMVEEGERKHETLPTLLNTLVELVRLRTLSLKYFYPAEDSLPKNLVQGYSAARFLSIVDLTLGSCALSYLFLIRVCPSLLRLAVIDSAYHLLARLSTAALGIMHGTHLHRLERLTIPMHSLSLFAASEVSAVRHLYLHDMAGEDQASAAILSCALPVFRPQSIKLSTRFLGEFNPLWRALAQQHPAVRVMDVEVVPHSYRPWCDTWPDCVPSTLVYLPLVALRLIVRTSLTVGIVSGGQRAREVNRALTGGPSRARREALASMPGKLFGAMPSLRVLAVAEEVEGGGGRQKFAAAAAAAAAVEERAYMNGGGGGGEEETGDPVGRAEWDTLSRTGFQFGWWCRGAPGIAPVRVSAREGEETYRVVEGALDADSAEADGTDRESSASGLFDGPADC
ncbi:hypothetical protein BC628DRAFT_1333382 [Trametes gibbosa]|nr:hypothetical protein BC628DRAFT_1333382 [Trametes gibbosa]